MRRAIIVGAAICLGIAAGGCGSAEPPKPTAEKAPADPRSPKQVVHDFLEAVRTGDADGATNLLSRLAQERTAAQGATITPPSSKTAKFEVNEVEIVGEGGAHVASTWTDLNEEGQPHTDNVIWMVRQDEEGWRIVGMATKVFPDQPPLIQNFEDPADMMRKQQLVQQEMERRAAAELGGEAKADQPGLAPATAASGQAAKSGSGQAQTAGPQRPSAKGATATAKRPATATEPGNPLRRQ
jgi:hypothetical protein